MPAPTSARARKIAEGCRVGGQGLLQPPAALGEVPAYVPEAPERAGEAQAEFGRLRRGLPLATGRRGAPGQRRPQIVQLGF
jgi:hypothetical protein